VKRGGSLSFLARTISNVMVMEIGWTDVGSGGYILVSCAQSNTSYVCHRPVSCVSIVFYVFHRLVYPMLPVSLDCPFLIAHSVFSNVYFQN
jgi:hypothetical protein